MGFFLTILEDIMAFVYLTWKHEKRFLNIYDVKIIGYLFIH